MSALTLALECTLIGFVVGGGARKPAFNQEWMDKNFGKQHKEAFGKDAEPSPQGYPDIGSGRYTKALTYKNWM